MGNMIPQKSFDAQMHIIRDVHFDVDKYKIDELYVIKHNIINAHIIDGKMIGKLVKAEADALTFDIFAEMIPEGVSPTDPHNYYGIKTITLLLDDIIEQQIEIERLLTETEAAVYLGMAALDEAKQSTLDPKDPKFNRLLGLTPDRSQFPCTLENTHSYQELQAAYKIDEETAKECVDYGQMAKDLVEEKDNYHPKIQGRYGNMVCKRYVTMFNGETNDILINGHINVAAFHDSTNPRHYHISLKKDESIIKMKFSPSKMSMLNDRIIIGDRSCSTNIVLHADTMCEMFDEIVISDEQ